ncbi:MAG: non-homologous end-joining DNA ligase [Opitutaceae bacterium]|nr:non-homologous end-joining DNA ligase [Opitutaceae bacterium]
MPKTSNRLTASQPAEFLEPMKVLSVEEIPVGTWRSEIKYDGYRALAVISRGKVELWSRNRKPLGEAYPAVVEELSKLPCTSAVIDGEIVALDEQGRSRFQLLQNTGEETQIRYFAFDLLHLDGVSLLKETLEARQDRLKGLFKRSHLPVLLSTWFDTDPASLLDAAREQGLEGIVAKRSGSIYEPGHRNGLWVKCKVLREQEFVIGGFTAPRNARLFFGALLVGYYEEGVLLCAGKVGTGFSHALLGSLHKKLQRLATRTNPFGNLPSPRKPRFGTGLTKIALKEVTWTRPVLVAQIKFSEWTADGMLRQPVFLGLREDKDALEVSRDP